MERFQAPSFCPGCGKPQASWLPNCRSCGTRFADSCVVCRRAITVGAGTCADHVGAYVPPPPPAVDPPPAPHGGGFRLSEPAWSSAAGLPSGVVPASPRLAPPAGGVSDGRRVLQILVGVVAAVIISVGIGAALIGTSSAEDRLRDYVSGTGEKEFFASDLQFRATFPTVPTRNTQKLPGTDQDFVLYTSDLGDAGLAIGAFDLPRNQDFDLNLSVNGAAVAIGGHVETSKLTTFEGYPAAEFLVSTGQGLYDKGLIVRATDRIYQLQAIAKTNPPAGYDHFKDSFHIVKP